MKKTLLLLIVSFAVLLSCASCAITSSVSFPNSSLSSISSQFSSSTISTPSASIQQPTSETPIIGSAEVAWFDLTIKSVSKTYTYGTYTATDGNVLLDVVISLTNTFDEELPFWNEEFTLDDPADQEYYDLPFRPEEVGSEDLMPAEFTLGINQTVEYHLIYEVPITSSNFALIYEEYFDDDTTGETYTIYLGI